MMMVRLKKVARDSISFVALFPTGNGTSFKRLRGALSTEEKRVYEKESLKTEMTIIFGRFQCVFTHQYVTLRLKKCLKLP